jgi:hypothetical protein
MWPIARQMNGKNTQNLLLKNLHTKSVLCIVYTSKMFKTIEKTSLKIILNIQNI